MKIFLAADHAGFDLKKALNTFLLSLGNEVIDKGNLELDPEDDYPDFVSLAAAEVSKNPANSKAIVIGRSGQGEAIVANRFPNVRAAVFYGQPKQPDLKSGPDEISLTRLHNDSNVLSLGARFLSEDDAKRAVQIWLETPFSGAEKHLRRIQKIERVASRQ